jgi:Ca2+-binding RTX toxin-like protein
MDTGDVVTTLLVAPSTATVTNTNIAVPTVVGGQSGRVYYGPDGSVQEVDIGTWPSGLIPSPLPGVPWEVQGLGSQVGGGVTLATSPPQGMATIQPLQPSATAVPVFNATIIGQVTAETIFGSGGTDFLNIQNTVLVDGMGADTAVAGTGAATIFGGTGPLLVFGDTGKLLFAGGAGASTIVGGATGPTMFGCTGGDVTFTSNQASGLLVAGAGNVTLSAAGSTSNNSFWAGSGADIIMAGAGADTIAAGSGSMTATGGAGADVFVFFSANGGAHAVIDDFTASDMVLLSGYKTAAITPVVSGGNTTIVLPDNTMITFAGVTQLAPGQIVTS